MRRASIITAALVAAFVVSGPAAAGSDSPTPYTVTASGIALPRALAAHDHVNVRLVDGRTASLHLDPNNGHPGGAWIGAAFLPWSALGITDGCVAWIQWSGANEHYGEGGQAPICLTTTPTPEPSWTAEPEPSVEPTPSVTPPQPEPSSAPSPTSSPSVDPSPDPVVTVEPSPEPSAPTSEPEPTPSSSSPSPSSTPTPSSTPSTDVELEPTPGPDVDHPTREPDLEPTMTTIAEPLPATLPVTGAGTLLAWIAGGLLALGAVLVTVARRR